EVPSLRLRPEDLDALTRRFLREIGEVPGPRELAPDALARLRAYRWPGNVRELRNVLSAAAASAQSCIDARDIDRALARVGGAPGAREVSTQVMARVLAECGGNRAATARALGIPRSTLRDRLRAARE
ncbi:MAG TPA: helix-turn-helix domain-containing protein, partial [Polyangiales bacterium]